MANNAGGNELQANAGPFSATEERILEAKRHLLMAKALLIYHKDIDGALRHITRAEVEFEGLEADAGA
jgi:hypothetical protein